VAMASGSRISLISQLLDEMVSNPNCQSLKLKLFFDNVELDLQAKTTVFVDGDE